MREWKEQGRGKEHGRGRGVVEEERKVKDGVRHGRKEKESVTDRRSRDVGGNYIGKNATGGKGGGDEERWRRKAERRIL